MVFGNYALLIVEKKRSDNCVKLKLSSNIGNETTMKLKFFKLILITVCSIPLVNCTTQLVNSNIPLANAQSIDDVFNFSLPASVSKLNDAKLLKLMQQMSKEAGKLAEKSKTAGAEQFTDQNFTMFAAYATVMENLLIILYQEQLPVTKDRDAMLELNTRRINWGIAGGYLSPTSKGVTKLNIDGIPSLLMDVVLATGERLQTYTFFISTKDYGSMGYAMVIKTKSSTQVPYTNLIKHFIDSLRIKLPLDKTKCVIKPVMTDEERFHCGAKPL